jgi:predicted nucleic acid-binding protein
MTPIVLDTDVASAVLKGRAPGSLLRQGGTNRLAITFVTVGELTQWTYVRRGGPSRTADLDRFFRQDVVVLPYTVRVATIWGEIQAHARLRGRTRPVNDSWIAACCLAFQLPLATLNTKDFADFAEHEGLDLVG